MDKYNFGNLEANKNFLQSLNIDWKDKKVLEIGCGKGSMTKYLFDKGTDVVGIDTDREYLSVAKKRFGKEMNNRFRETSGAILGFPGEEFDIVVSFDVLEHIKDVEKHVEEVWRILKDDGLYLLQTPNKVPSIIFDVFRYKSFTKNRKVHVSLQSRKSLLALFRNANFQVDFVEVDYFTSWYRQKLPKILRRINPRRLGLETNFYVKAKK